VISVIIPTLNDEARLAGTLAPIVPAAMQGLVRELIVVDGGSTDATLEVADDAGAMMLKVGGDVAARLAAGAAKAKGPWLLCIEPGVELELGWIAAVEKHIARSRKAARFDVRRRDAGLAGRLIGPKVVAAITQKGEVDLKGPRLPDARGWI